MDGREEGKGPRDLWGDVEEPAKESERGQQGRRRPSKRPGEDRVSRRREQLTVTTSDLGVPVGNTGS